MSAGVEIYNEPANGANEGCLECVSWGGVRLFKAVLQPVSSVF